MPYCEKYFHAILMVKNWSFPVAQLVKNLPAMHETWVRSLGWDDPLEEEMANYCRILAVVENPMDKGAWPGLQPMGSQESDMT